MEEPLGLLPSLVRTKATTGLVLVAFLTILQLLGTLPETRLLVMAVTQELNQPHQLQQLVSLTGTMPMPLHRMMDPSTKSVPLELCAQLHLMALMDVVMPM